MDFGVTGKSEGYYLAEQCRRNVAGEVSGSILSYGRFVQYSAGGMGVSE
jgi:hypothetical protein